MTLALPPGQPPSLEHLADWAELRAMTAGNGALSSAEVMEICELRYGDAEAEDRDLEEALLEEESGESESAAHAPAYSEITTAEERWQALALALSFRAQVVGEAYPLSVEPDAIVVRTDGEWEARLAAYQFLALVGARLLYGLSEQLPVHEPARLFEHVVAHALGNYVGGRGYRFGWPLKPGETGTFPERVRRLARAMGEASGSMRSAGPHDKDHQLDVIAWRSLADSTPEDPTPGQAVVVCQCGIGANWAEKVLPPQLWKEIINFAVQPVGALAFPIVPSRSDTNLHTWFKVTSVDNIPFDRLRIASLVDIETLPGDVVAGFGKWSATALDALPEE